ncbi:MAG: quinolinate synthase NadA [Candidatus Melainabacteria bacterium]|nr:quinolinate synthase NadA [Candidatus Melainabacteria bacterium]
MLTCGTTYAGDAPVTVCLPPTSSAPASSSAGSSLLEQRQQLIETIKMLKTERNAVILAHLYERLEVQDMADYQGDSLGLSQQAAATEAETIVFCGVHFMAETAKLLSPHKTVYLANPHAGCPMADMITVEQLRTFKAQYPGVPVVAYVNTTAAVKAESDICCTSANAVDVVRHLNVERVLFVPDKHLGAYVQSQLPDVEVICWDGFCPTHLRIDEADLTQLRKTYPEALVLVHPECDEPVKAVADFIGSTTAILQAAKHSAAQQFIVCTEDGVAQRLAADYPHRQFFTPSRAQAICPNMKMTRLNNVYKALLGHVPEVTIEPAVASAARQTLDRMLTVPITRTNVNAGSAACRCKSTPA